MAKAGFQPGVSGNPKGRPRLDEQARSAITLAQSYSCNAIETLNALLSSRDETVRMQAANAILDRAIGKPAQTITQQTETTVCQLTVNEMRDMVREALPKLELASELQALPEPIDDEDTKGM